MEQMELTQKAQMKLLFEGSKGREPKTDEELQQWLVSPEGVAAMAFELTSLSPWGEKGRA